MIPCCSTNLRRVGGNIEVAIMDCVQCGANIVSMKQGCMFCGEPYRPKLPVRFTSFHRKALLGITMVAILAFVVHCSYSVGYDQVTYLRSPEMQAVSKLLAEGKTGEARVKCRRVCETDWYSGFPGALMAASYYRDYMKGSDSALYHVGEYAREAHDRDPSFATGYYLALYHYEKTHYERSLELANAAKDEMTGITRWANGHLDRKKWQRAVRELARACEHAMDNNPPLRPRFMPLDDSPEHQFFEVEFRLCPN